MRVNFGEIVQRILRRLHLTPLSLAAKCRIMFGAAVLFSLIIALLIPYIWMRQQSRMVLLEANKAKATVLLHTHFQLKPPGQVTRPQLTDGGAARDPNGPGIVWVRFQKEQDKTDLSGLSERQKRMLDWLAAHPSRDDTISLSKVEGSVQSDYVRLFRATESCISCHNSQGTAPAFTLHEPVGAAVIQTRGIGREVRWMALMNRLWIIVAGVIGGTGAIVAFY
jgi:hypothetical protein